MIALHSCGQRYIHMHWRQRQYTVSCLGAGRVGCWPPSCPTVGPEGSYQNPTVRFQKACKCPTPAGTTPQIHTVRRMMVTYATRGIVGYLLLWKYFGLFPLLKIVEQFVFLFLVWDFPSSFPASLSFTRSCFNQIHSFSACNACKIKFTRNSLYCLIIMFTYSSRNATGEVISLCLTENFIILAL